MLRRDSSVTSADNVDNTSSKIGVRNPGDAFKLEVWPYERITNNSHAHVNSKAVLVPVATSDMSIIICLYMYTALA